METAIQAAKRGHKVDLYEKSDKLGGAFIAAAALSFKEKDKELLEWYARELKKTDVSVHMNTEVTDLNGLAADEIVIATGAKSPRRLQIPGAERAIDAISYLMNQEQVGQKVAVYLESKTKEIKEKSIVLETKDGEVEVVVDSVIWGANDLVLKF